MPLCSKCIWHPTQAFACSYEKKTFSKASIVLLQEHLLVATLPLQHALRPAGACIWSRTCLLEAQQLHIKNESGVGGDNLHNGKISDTPFFHGATLLHDTGKLLLGQCRQQAICYSPQQLHGHHSRSQARWSALPSRPWRAVQRPHPSRESLHQLPACKRRKEESISYCLKQLS